MNRREFLEMGALAALSAAAGCKTCCEGPFAVNGVRIGVQMYSVDDLWKPNPAAAFDFADWTGRGISDLFVSTNFRVTRLAGCDREMTTFRRPEFVDLPDGPLYLGLHENQLAFADIDADGVPEMLVGAESGMIHVFHRDYISGAVSRAAVRAVSPKKKGPKLQPAIPARRKKT